MLFFVQLCGLSPIYVAAHKPGRNTHPQGRMSGLHTHTHTDTQTHTHTAAHTRTDTHTHTHSLSHSISWGLQTLERYIKTDIHKRTHLEENPVHSSEQIKRD